MKLITKALERKLPRLYANENRTPEETPIIFKLFSRDSIWTFYATEGEKRGDDWLLFGLIDWHEKELGYFLLSELSAARGPLGLPIERDLHFGNHTLGEYMQ
jgi:hypothetical protein